MFCFVNLFFICIFLISLFLAICFFYTHFFFHLPSRVIFGPRLTDSLYNQSLLPCSISPLVNGEMISWYINVQYFSERFQPRSHFKCKLSLIVRVNVVQIGLLLTVTDVSTTCAVVIFRVKVSCITSVDGIILWLLI